ncbi:IS1595 family transposase [Spartinivicinus poritis]|uniref:IS1595 family transposase n=1 Tax=Spartinivicinus poritis TaxID=2994640 RepID=A0ABT5UI68_9GAMM|nr:IS1595 family transposase [Spartinivicinus sp. A2-2]MDE1466099.1 IS1595 family transposase [Spartinivicinus sp. A2-2]
MINIKQLVSDEYCYQLIRQRRWPEGICCPYCQSKGVKSHGYHATQKACKRYHCQSCKNRFDDLIFTVFAGHHQPLKVWILCMYFMGLVKRGGQLIIRMLENVKQKTISPIIKQLINPGTLIYTDEYNSYSRLPAWGYQHKTVCHGKGEYARDEDGDGFHEVHVNTIEGCWSLLRSWFSPHRGISQEKLPYYLALFELVYNLKRRGKGLLNDLVGLLV